MDQNSSWVFGSRGCFGIERRCTRERLAVEARGDLRFDVQSDADVPWIRV